MILHDEKLWQLRNYGIANAGKTDCASTRNNCAADIESEFLHKGVEVCSGRILRARCRREQDNKITDRMQLTVAKAMQAIPNTPGASVSVFRIC
jgi:hypothetical protein